MKARTESIKKKTHMLAACLLMVGASFALPASAAYSSHTVVAAGCLADGTCFAAVSPAIPAASSTCDIVNADQVRWTATSAAGQEWSRIATAALLSGKRITVDTLPSSCNNGYPLLNQLHIMQ